MSCRELEAAQLAAAAEDQKRARTLGPDEPQRPTRYRKWSVRPATHDPKEDTSP